MATGARRGTGGRWSLGSYTLELDAAMGAGAPVSMTSEGGWRTGGDNQWGTDRRWG